MTHHPHPGKILKEDCIEPLGLSITEVASKLGVSKTTLSEIIDEKAEISPELALKLGKAFNTSPEFWVNMQSYYYLAKARKTTNLDDIEELYG